MERGQESMISKIADIEQIHVLRIPPGGDILLSLREFVAEKSIRFGAILNGIGSATKYRVHVVKTTDLPPGDVFFGEEGAFDILNITGFIVEGRVHAHITLSNTEKAVGGHLEEGTSVLTFSIITLGETPQCDFSQWDKIREF